MKITFEIRETCRRQNYTPEIYDTGPEWDENITITVDDDDDADAIHDKIREIVLSKLDYSDTGYDTGAEWCVINIESDNNNEPDDYDDYTGSVEWSDRDDVQTEYWAIKLAEQIEKIYAICDMAGVETDLWRIDASLIKDRGLKSDCDDAEFYLREALEKLNRVLLAADEIESATNFIDD